MFERLRNTLAMWAGSLASIENRQQEHLLSLESRLADLEHRVDALMSNLHHVRGKSPPGTEFAGQ